MNLSAFLVYYRYFLVKKKTSVVWTTFLWLDLWTGNFRPSPPAISRFIFFANKGEEKVFIIQQMFVICGII
jgi:hypothetical protein